MNIAREDDRVKEKDGDKTGWGKRERVRKLREKMRKTITQTDRGGW